jgi:tRNA dimethylallyltransferase
MSGLQKIIIITGATASGKSAYAIEIANQIGGIIINADAMQLYHDAPILTAQPNADELSRANHNLYGVFKADDVCNVARYIELIKPIIHEAWRDSMTPILVGGTGMYLKGVMSGIAYVPDIAPEIRDYVRTLSIEQLREELLKHDKAIFEKFKQYDSQRLGRALEVVLSTGKSLLWWQMQELIKPFADVKFELYVMNVERAELYQRINQRYIQMIEQGGLLEVEQLMEAGYDNDLPLMRSVGIRQLLGYKRGDYDLEQAIILGQAASRQYAKRQLTWIRNQWHDYEIIGV